MSTRSECTFRRIRITGKDRAKFLHNFCTNNVKALTEGNACEAFFTDVKARILAHGYVLSLESCHEIWMLPGDPAALAKHLSRYVITEDVTVMEMSTDTTIVLRESPELFARPPFSEWPVNAEGTLCGQASASGEAASKLTCLRFSWASERLLAVSGDAEQIAILRAAISSVPEVSMEEFEVLRIRERFPVIGRDMSNEHLAPEAERNSVAISYTKGCYLGQEPIARLDAMGHVNRALRVIELSGDHKQGDICGRPLITADNAVAGTITSAVQSDAASIVGLAMVKVSATTQTVFCELEPGVKLSGRCRPL
ncbi:MAG: hypothetical protein U0936_22735 [Planctomycetaceae bacterium]